MEKNNFQVRTQEYFEAFRTKNEILIREKKYKTNASIAETLPSYDTLVSFVNDMLKFKGVL